VSRPSGSAGRSSSGDPRPARRPSIHWGLALAGFVWLLWVANFNDLRFGGIDADRPYSFLRRMFGETSEFFGYQFGLAFLWSPFYAVGKLLKVAGLETVEGEPVGIATITLGTSLLVAVTCVLLLPVLRRLDLSSHEGLVLLAAVFGTPLFYYGSFKTGLSHVVDTLLVTVLVVLVHRWSIAVRRSPWLAVAIGVVGGYAVSVRSFQGFVVLAIVLGLAFYRDYRAAATSALVAAVTFLAFASVPLLLGVDSLTSGYDSNTNEAVSRTFELSPDTLARMLFSRYGLFVWTPVTLLGLIGFGMLLRQRRDVRPFLVLTTAIGLAILLPYVFVPFFTPGYSQRYLTQLFPIVVLGLAALVESRARVAVPVVIAAVVWSVSLAFYGEEGLEYTDHAFGFPRRVVSGEITPSEYAHAVFHRARLLDLLPDPFDDG
jgi:hypothetical protein